MTVDTFWLCQTSRRNMTEVLCSSCGLDNCVAIYFLVCDGPWEGDSGRYSHPVYAGICALIICTYILDEMVNSWQLYSASVLLRPFSKGGTPCRVLMTPCLFQEAEMMPCLFLVT